jgi:hypothetical protein
MLDNTIVTTFVLACVALVVLTLGFFAKTWMSTLNSTIKELNDNVHEMSGIIASLKEEQALQRLRLRHQAEELNRVKLLRGCTQENCPYKAVLQLRDGDLSTGANLTEADIQRISSVIASRENLDDSH